MNQMRVLLVDDSKSARYALRILLQRQGIAVQTADSAEAALERIREDPPQTVFMDHTMPGMNGFEALEILKTSPATAHIPVVMCTSNEDPQFLTQAVRKGAFAILSKSTTAGKLENLLQRLQQALATAPQMSAGENGSQPATAQPETPPQGPPRLDIGLSEEQLGTHIGALVEPLLEARTEQLTKELRAELEERLRRHRHEAQGEQPPLTTDRLLNHILPPLLEQRLKLERERIDRDIENRIADQLATRLLEPPLLERLAEAMAPQIAEGATEAATHQTTLMTQTLIEERSRRIDEPLSRPANTDKGTLLALAAIAALIGAMAAAGIFFSLHI